MHSQNLLRLFFAAAATIVLIALISAFAAVNIVESSRLTDQTIAITITADDLKPSQCSMTLRWIRYCPVTGKCTFNSGDNDLVLGTSNADDMSSMFGDDCLLGGGGNDSLDGGQHINGDVCIGGPGTDTFSNCETAIQ